MLLLYVITGLLSDFVQVQMKNKIKNTEMEYIAKAKCGGDSSFPTHSFRRSYFSNASMITVLCKSLYVFQTVDTALKSLRIF